MDWSKTTFRQWALFLAVVAITATLLSDDPGAALLVAVLAAIIWLVWRGAGAFARHIFGRR